MLRRVLGLALPLVLLAGAARAQPPVWVARDADSTLVLFGSVHMLPPGLDWTPPALDAALKEADDLWFELPIDADTTVASAQAAMRLGVAPPGQRLSSLLSPEGQGRLARLIAKLELPAATIESFRPWLAEVTLTVAFVTHGGADENAGVERQLSAAAPPSARRRAFETAQEQIAIFADVPLADQLASLEETLRQLEDEPGAFDGLVAAWVSGDVKALETLGLEPLKAASPQMYERLIAARNRRWADVLEKRLAGSGKTVVVVGAGHLIGADGLPALLRARGVAVEGP